MKHSVMILNETTKFSYGSGAVYGHVPFADIYLYGKSEKGGRFDEDNWFSTILLIVNAAPIVYTQIIIFYFENFFRKKWL